MSYPLNYNGADDVTIECPPGHPRIKLGIATGPDGHLYLTHEEAITVAERLALVAWEKSRELGE